MQFIDVSTGRPANRRHCCRCRRQNIVPGPALNVYHPFGQEMGGGRLFVHAKGDPYTLVTSITAHHPRAVC